MFDNTMLTQLQSVVTDGMKVTYDNTTLITDNIARGYLAYKYGSFICPDMYSKYTLYVTMTAGDLSKALDAWNSVYNPIDNYNGETTRITTDDHGDEIRKHETGDENGLHNKATTQALANTSSNEYTTTFDDTNPRLANKTETVGGTETIDDVYTTDTTTHETVTKTIDNDTITADNIHTEKEIKHGNLGVTTTQQMIQSEVDMRLNPLIQQYLDRFIYQYAFYAGGAWGKYGDFI